jgi:CcmD family protein
VSYLLAAYVVVLVTVLAYLVIHALKIARLEGEVAELVELAREQQAERETREEAHVGG